MNVARRIHSQSDCDKPNGKDEPDHGVGFHKSHLRFIVRVASQHVSEATSPFALKVRYSQPLRLK